MTSRFLAGDGEMRDRLRAFDWSTTDLGPIESWPQSLKTVIDVMMAMSLPLLMLWGPHRRMLYNDGYAAFAGNRHPGALGAPVRDIWSEMSGSNHKVIDDAFQGQSITLEAQHRTLYRKGAAEDVWVNLNYAPVRDEQGDVAAALVAVIEMTETRAMEMRLKAREESFRTMAEAIPNHAWTGGPDGMLDWFNKRVYEYTGAKPSELDGERWSSVIHPDDLPRAGAAWAQSLRDGSPYEIEFRVRRHDGVYSWFLARALPVRDETQRIIRWVGTNTDISRQREIEEAQRALNRTLEMRIAERTADRDRMWRLSQDLMIVVNDTPEVTIVAVNPAWQRLLGWTEAELLGRSAIDFVHPDDMSVARSASRPYIEILSVDGRVVRRYENRYRHKDGSWRWISWTVVADDDILQGVGRDLTADKARAEALALAEAQLRQAQKMEAVGQLTGGIAHDFNNMLAVVIGSLGLLKRRLAKGDTNIVSLADNALDGATRAASLTHRLLAFSRQQPLKLEAILTNQLVTGILELMIRTLGETIHVETALDKALWQAHTDPHQLENAVLNLAVNARDAMPDGGTLKIETANATIGARDAAGHPGVAPGQYVLITVHDTGVGMEPEVVTKAFDPFFTTKEVGKGTGLGLSQVYGFVQQSGGHVTIDSKPGYGTAVRIYLPRFAGAAEKMRDTPVPAADARPAITAILIVEDEPSMRRVSADALTELGYRVLEADSAAAALKALAANPEIVLMFTDIVMPEIDGARLAELAKLQRPDLKVLFTTGHTRDTVIRGETLDPGTNLIAKPFTIEQLAAKLHEALAS